MKPCLFLFVLSILLVTWQSLQMEGFYDGGEGRGRAIGLAQDFPVHDDKIVSVF